MIAPKLDTLHCILLGALLAFIVGYFKQRLLAAREGRRAAALDEQLKALRDGPRQAEQRIDRYELLWFPQVSYAPASMEISAVLPGKPHCRSCVTPLSATDGGFRCPGCGASFPESLADLQVLDSVGKLALEQFQQRNKGYRLVLKK